MTGGSNARERGSESRLPENGESAGGWAWECMEVDFEWDKEATAVVVVEDWGERAGMIQGGGQWMVDGNDGC